MSPVSLKNKVCLVTGATRGIGKGIALQLGAAGAKVYITGRTLEKPNNSVGGSLNETTAEIEDHGGTCVPVQCDHGNDEEVRKLFERIKIENDGQLDVLVNNAFTGAPTYIDNFGKPFWEVGTDMWDQFNHVGLRNHYHCSVYAAQMMVPRKQGFIVNISSAAGIKYVGNVVYGIKSIATDTMAAGMACELRKHNVTVVSIWPGFVGTALIMDKIKREKKFLQYEEMFENGETIEYTGIAILHLAADPKIMAKSGRTLIVTDIGDEYGFTDITGVKPPNPRSMAFGLGLAGWKRTAAWIPSRLKWPCWMIHMWGYKF